MSIKRRATQPCRSTRAREQHFYAKSRIDSAHVEHAYSRLLAEVCTYAPYNIHRKKKATRAPFSECSSINNSRESRYRAGKIVPRCGTLSSLAQLSIYAYVNHLLARVSTPVGARGEIFFCISSLERIYNNEKDK